jgi:hypothetical protein
MPNMAKSLWFGLISILMVVLLWIMPSFHQFASALELPEELQDLLNQAATDLNFPYSAPAKEDEDSAEEQMSKVLDQHLDSHASVKAPTLESPALPSKGQKVAPSPQRLN